MGRSAPQNLGNLDTVENLAGRPAQAGATAPGDTDPSPRGNSASPGSPSRRRWRLRNWRLLTKFTALLVIPLVLAVALGATRVATSVSVAGELEGLRRQVELSQQVAGIVQELQRERHLVAALLATDSPGDRAAAEEQIGEVDALIATFRATDVAVEDLTPEAGQAYLGALDQLEELPALRAELLAPNAIADIAIGRYGGRIGVLLRFNRLALAGADASLRATANAVDALAAAKEQVSVQHAVLLASSLTGDLLAFQQDFLRESNTRFEVAIGEFTETSTQSAGALYLATVSGAAVSARARLLNAALNLARSGSPVQIDPAEWNEASTETAGLIRQVEGTLFGELVSSSAALSEQARNDAIGVGVAVAAAVLVALLFLLLVARSVLGPLRTLRAAAFDIADRQLPAVVERLAASDGRGADVAVRPVPVDTDEDIGEMARAFDAVHGEAVRLASEQAQLRANVNDIFVNLSRRSQSLVERQLQLIDQLEDGERDPEQLASLFRLDHLATRMRRNSENLLVLAGADLQRRAGHSVPVLDVLRAAASEVEQYRRVSVKPPPTATVAGPAVSDLVHLVAELLDNATAYSPPDSPVGVASAIATDGCLLIELSDTGAGLAPDRLDAINRRLAEPPRVDVSVSRQMGLFVVARLAARHGVTVRLTSSEVVAGVTAQVRVPSALIGTDAASGRDAGPPPGRTPPGPTASTSGEDGLFGPPAAADPADPLFGSAPPADSLDRDTPIFEDVVSAWFRDLRTVPVSVPDRTDDRSADWGTAADKGRQAAQALHDPGGTPEYTTAGLPKRRPRARLVPGAAEADRGAAGAAPERAARTAEGVRGRLSSYQRGVREGREALRRRSGTHTDQSSREEQ